ncbi:TPA: hypothetical protein ACPUT0_002701 [Klebsiella pneumoniae]|uniref:hypothetical protein n=1 Tax=Klebsiella variicola TaxID=244366 RepID=UPI001CCD869D
MAYVNHIKNPLTIVGIFAGIVEVSANMVLPFLDSTNQSLYIWFLMLFPTGLVVVFFSILNWNHTVLYAPSDFKSDSAFVEVHASNSVKFSKNNISGNSISFATSGEEK